VIPPKANRKTPRRYRKALYKQRNRMERCFSKLKHFRRIATRFEKKKDHFHSLVLWLAPCFYCVNCRYKLVHLNSWRRPSDLASAPENSA
jgi:hypothetical protein